MEKLKQKVASSSSRVIASLQQAATGTFQQQPQQPQPHLPQQLGEPRPLRAPPDESDGRGVPMLAAHATAHLTDQEREILFEVWRKEEQFRRDTIKQMNASRAQQAPRSSEPARQAPQQSSLQQQLQQQPAVAGFRDPSPGSAHSGTPLSSRPASAFGPGGRAASACSGGSAGPPHQLDQCRICRKLIPANEACHLCSNCNQFICEDCASYSASDKHWMCSSCRRRATKPAIPADTMRELGLNQHSSPVRRMTLRINEIQAAGLGHKSRADSSKASSGSSSGCSSMSVLGATSSSATSASRGSSQTVTPQAIRDEQRLQHQQSSKSIKGLPSPKATRQQRQASVCDQVRPPDTAGALVRRPSSSLTAAQELAAQMKLSDMKPPSQLASDSAAAHVRPGGQVPAGRAQQAAAALTMARRASVAASSAQRARATPTPGARKQSAAFQYTPFQAADLHRFSKEAQTVSYLVQRRQSRQFMQPQTMVTASSDMSVNNLETQRRSSVAQQMQLAGSSLIPIPPDQFHLRRLSDQSNLVRRSSIIADSLEGIVLARNRSHSNIDSIRDSNLFYQAAVQPQYGYQDEGPQSFYDQQLANQRLLYGDQSQYQWQMQQQVQQQPMQQPQDMVYTAQEYHQQKQQQQQQPFTSIITSYAQKQRRSSEDLHSDSSSDIEEDSRVPPTGLDYEGEPNDFFAPPRALSAAMNYGNSRPSLNSDLQDQVPISIPSVSVSEFRFSQQRLQQAPGSQQQLFYDQTSATPMQINVAIEQAIKQQQQQQQVLRSHELDPNQGYLMPRRSSTGRVLPKVPGEQSRSLLDLPFNDGSQQGTVGDPHHSMLDLPVISPTVRRASAPEGQNIKIVVDDMDGSMRNSISGKSGRALYSKQGDLYERLVLYRDESSDPMTNSARGFGIRVSGGKIDEDNKLQAFVTWVQPGGPADKVGLKRGDIIIEWDGKCLVNMSYEQVAEVIESSANIAELLVKPAHRLEPGANYVRSQRRLSQQTERDLRRSQPFNQFTPDQSEPNASSKHRMSCQLQSIQISTSGVQRTGTGRKLPKIPGMMVEGLTLPSAEPMSLKHASTGQLDNQMNGFEHTSNLLSTGNDRLAFMQNGSSPGALNDLNGVQQSQQQHSMHQNGYPMSSNNGYLDQDDGDKICGLIGLQVSVDERVNQLEISIVSATNMKLSPIYDYYVRVKILPESNRFKPCSTQPSSDMNWNETFIFQNFPTQQSNRMALDISIWKYDEAPRLSAQIAQPLCEAMIPIQSARERNTDFWPLRPPVSSPQTRRKSLNDLMETRNARRAGEAQLSNGPQQVSAASSAWFNQPDQIRQLAVSSQNVQQTSDTLNARGPYMSRERSASNRNLPDTNKLRGQPRRASDEVAGSSSQRLMARVSPAASRRSISVMNVGDNLSRPSSRLGSQSNILKAAQLRRDSKQYQQVQSSTGSPILKAQSQTADSTPKQCDSPGVGYTPSGRRSSLVGIQTMIGYQSQKNSQSNSSDHKSSPTKSGLLKTSQERATNQNLTASPDTKYRTQHRASVASVQPSAPAPTPISSGTSSRRGSSEHPQIQRKGSFASSALRKLKRTMSFSKASDQEQVGSNQTSRQGSLSSGESTCELAEDLGVTRRIVNHTDFVGKLKLSFIMTKGQLEVDVLNAQGLKYDLDSSLGVYVKMYLKGKTKTNKKKTRLVQPWQSPTFKQLIKYDASLVDNKSLEVSVWQKQGALKGKVPVGYTEIRLSELNLIQLQTSWYNLRSMGFSYSSSIDD